ncbi:sodium/hydrogen exchanger 10-like isoform X4 [Bacillus rossius redtenbacheri]|uniref:sodium/hydrogen exchanger 10-like isoform X4 n=1 Tax=Bacillus rossius redtenbacheri TaxID=93214 RepID=UPI002FDE5854
MKYLRILILLLLVNLSSALTNGTENLLTIVNDEYSRIWYPLLLMLAAGIVVRMGLSQILHLPFPLGLMFLGFFIGWLTKRIQPPKIFDYVNYIHPKILLLLFLPVLNFKTAYEMDGHTFFRIFWQIFIVGLPGFIFSSMITAFISMVLFQSYYWQWTKAFMFGVIASTTFCHDVVMMLRDFDQSNPLVTLLEGENLLGDATALAVFYTIIAKRQIVLFNKLGLLYWDMLFFVIHYCVNGILIGCVCGQLTFTLCQRAMTDITWKIIMILSVSYITFFLAEEIIGTCGVVQVSLLGIFMGFLKSAFNDKLASTLKLTWESLYIFTETIAFVVIGILVMDATFDVIETQDILRGFFTYILCNTSRAVMYMVLLPVLQPIGYGLSFRDAVIAVLGSQYGILGVILSLMVMLQMGHEKMGLEFTIDITIMMMLKFIINGFLAPHFLRELGLLDISQTKKANMSNVIRLLGDAQRRLLSALLYEKFLAGAKWKTVEQATRIKNPYTLGRKDGVVDEFAQGVKDATTCPRCLEQSLPDVPSEEEVEEMIKEAEIRLLKTKMASYRRQFENGMLSSEGANILIAAVNDALNKGEMSVDVNTLAAGWELRAFDKNLSHFLAKLRKFIECHQYSAENLEHGWRKILYNIATNKIFDICINMVIFVNAMPIILQITLELPRGYPESKTFAVINSAFFVIYFMEFIIKMLAFGFVQFLQCHWNKVTVLIKLISLVDLIIDYVSNFLNPTDPTVALVAWVFLLLRFLHFQSPLRAIISLCSSISDRYVSRKLCQNFELQKCFINGEEEVLEMLKEMVYHRHVADHIKAKIENNLSTMEKRMGKILLETPDIEITVFTRQVAVSTLKHLKEAILKQYTRGMLDELEFKNLNRVMEMRLSHITTHYEMITMSDYPTLLRGVPWISGNEELAIAMEDLKAYGSVPRIDYFRHLDFSIQQEHTIPAGNLIGEMALVTDGVYDATVSCVTPVEMYEVPKESIEITPTVEHKIWNSVATRLAPLILQSAPIYVAYNTKAALARLERSFIINLKLIKRFRVTKLVKDVLLINGMARDELGGEIFIGPYYIPRTVHKLEVHYPSSPEKVDNVPSILFIIPEDEIGKDEIMQQISSASTEHQSPRYR